MLEFHNDAIVLSGSTGTQLKSDIIGKYYKKWWEITSGGPSKDFRYITTIIEMNAATGEVYIEDMDKTVLGSSGHALQLRHDCNKRSLGIVLVEEDNKCLAALERVIKKRWPNLSYSMFERGIEDDIFLMREPSFVDVILTQYRLGNSLFFFDPLLSESWQRIETIAKERIKHYYDTGTEFLIFLFSSDFFLGRGKFASLPNNNNEFLWSDAQLETVKKLDELFGDIAWREHLLDERPTNEKIATLTSLYKKRLQKWFRYVLPLPFIPKESQIYHIFFCSNYEAGVRLTKDFYVATMRNSKFHPDNKNAHSLFLERHPSKQAPGNRRSPEWKILWTIIKGHEDGFCDKKCKDLLVIVSNEEHLQNTLEWLELEGYICKIKSLTTVWQDAPQMYQLDWNFLESKLNVAKPAELVPWLTDRHSLSSTEPDKFTHR